ncbi:hypothetical protein [uncultured Shewanella sp.]|uniref:hypothetical protein n=1 Tax=uncultured Shewanella sp. TaxID=173975 RepID=UPI002612CE4F|nr:hypothetical protein [uncultured Shewanella sp.]
MPVITNQQLNALRGGGRELFPALNVDLNQSRQAIVKLSITVMFTGLCYGCNKLKVDGANTIDEGELDFNTDNSILSHQLIETTTHKLNDLPHGNKHQIMQLNLTSNQPNIDNNTNLHTFMCPAIDNELKIFHCSVQFLKQQKTVAILPILNTSNSTIEGINGACGQYTISFL